MNKNQNFASFGIWGFDDITHEMLTQQIGLEPSQVRIKGQSVAPHLKLIAQENSWIIKSPIKEDNKYASFEEQVDSLFALLKPKIEILKPICEKYDAEFSFAFYVYTDTGESMPVIHLSKEQNKLIGSLNAETDFDVILFAAKD